MVKLTVQVITIFSYTIAASEWVELPKMKPSRDIVTHSSREVTMVSLQTSASQIFTELYESETTSSPMKKSNEIEQIEMTENKLKTLQNYTTGVNYDVDGFSIWENHNETFYTGSDQKNVIEDSFIIEETINETTSDFMTEPRGSIAGKLKYLKQLENKLLTQTRMYAEGVWTDRQARGKKLLGFPSMEGALMTIAFLTFAVFLIKIVMQFIQGLQNAEQTLLMTLSSTPSPIRISNRPKRAAQNLAAAEILRYIDEYSIKHKLHCDFQ